MTSMALAATLFGPEDLRMVERPLDPLGLRHGAHPFRRRRHLRLRHALLPPCPHRRFRRDLAAGARPRDRGRGRRDRGLRARREGRRPRRRQSVALVRPLQALPREPAQSVREHLLHGLGLEDPAHAGRLCVLLRRHPGAMREDSRSRDVSGGGARPNRSRCACMRSPAPATSTASAPCCSAPARSAC